MPGRRRPRVVRHRRLAEVDVTTHADLRVTAAALTVIDAASELGIAILDSALLSGTVELADLQAAHCRYPRRHGSPAIAQYLQLLRDGTRSEAERVVATLFREAGLEGWTPNLPAEGYFIDMAFTRVKLAVEIDGFAYHRDVTTFQRGRTARNALIATGWTVLNFTWADVVERGDHVVTSVRNALARSLA